ncbi:MAG: hypothetical protein QM784_01860 [Polyangiaceae bacterium]
MQSVRVVAPAATLAAFLAVSGCGPSTASPKIGVSEPAASSAPTPSASAAPSAMGDVSTPSEYPDPSRLLEDDDVGEQETAKASRSNSGLTIRVRESGPTLPWLLRIVNEGDTPVDLVADTRLLWFEVKLPGQKKATTCKLPDALGPGAPEKRLKVTLEPGEGVQDLFDPRLYCFATGDQKLLVPDAEITPHFGWPAQPAKKVWKGGKRVEEPVLQQPPYVAEGRSEPAPAEPEAAAAPQENSAKNTAKATSKLAKKKAELAKKKAELEARAKVSDKELIGTTFELRSEYAAWSRRTDTHPSNNPSAPKPPLALSLVQGSDVRAEHNATIQLTLLNQSSEATHVYFRRELVTFEVTGPKGVTLCNATPDARSPSREAFVKLTSGAKRSYVSRLAELCPRGTFATPGLYLVYARFDASEAGSDVGLHAFTGPVVSEIPAAVRIRVGEEALLQKRMLPLDVRAEDVPREAIPPTLPGPGHESGAPHAPPPPPPPARRQGHSIGLPAPVSPGTASVPVVPGGMPAAAPPGDAPPPVSAPGPAAPPPSVQPPGQAQPPAFVPPPGPPPTMPAPTNVPPPPPQPGR